MGCQELTLQWIRTRSDTPAESGQDLSVANSEGVATKIYSVLLILLKELQRQYQGIWGKEQCSQLQEELHKLYLWGEVFENRELDIVLEYSDDARYTVLNILIDLGRSILKGTIPSTDSLTDN